MPGRSGPCDAKPIEARNRRRPAAPGFCLPQRTRPRLFRKKTKGRVKEKSNGKAPAEKKLEKTQDFT